MAEMTAEERADAILKVRYEEQGYMPLRDLLIIEITAAEERGRQSVYSRRHDWISGIADGSNLWHCSTCYVTHNIENELEMCPAMVAAPNEWEDLRHLQGRELGERLKARTYIWHKIANSLENRRAFSVVKEYPNDTADIQLLIDLIRQKEQALSAEVQRLEKGDGDAGRVE